MINSVARECQIIKQEASYASRIGYS